MADSLRVEGARQLRASLKRAGLELDDLKAIHAEVATLVSDVAKSRAPHRSGKLANSIRPAGTKSKSMVRAGFASVPYAGPIHWGWRKRNITANPFISDAAQSTETTWLARFNTEIERIVNTIEGA